MTRSRKLMSLGLLAALSLSFLPLKAMALTPSYAQPPFQRATYAAAVVGLAVPQTGAMDAVCVSGAAGKVVRIKRIAISGINATAQAAAVNLVLRSTANTGGTSTTPAVVALDSSDPAGGAVVRAYTVAPTAGTAIGTVRSQQVGLAASTAASASPVIWTFDPHVLAKEVVLRSAAQSACVNFPNAFTTAGPTINVDVTWTE